MSLYIRNKNCHCARCRTRGLLGAAVLVTLGVLFLLQNLTPLSFGESWPALLIVVGVFLYLGRSAPTEGHVQPVYAVAPVATAPPPPYAAPATPEQHPDQPNTQVNP